MTLKKSKNALPFFLPSAAVALGGAKDAVLEWDDGTLTATEVDGGPSPAGLGVSGTYAGEVQVDHPGELGVVEPVQWVWVVEMVLEESRRLT